jgi:hypothetical protein
MQDVYQKITALLNEVPAKLPDAYDQDWTRCIKSELAELGAERDHIVYANGIEAQQVRGEWVYDVTWAQESPDESGESNTKRIVLACECEWARNWGDVWDDFDKLLQSRADYRVFITHQFGGQSVDEITEKLIKRVDAYEQTSPGDTYLLAVYDNATRTFSPTLLEVLMPDNLRATRLMI